ncbi:MAG: bile acid:sodium symporter family protein [Phyllobacteriaceae bacterium]|jgi:BASS family bile acid:Na+ symporter|nr:bile acid:sodium symporter family protein [Phyllobacteriaceae bacterium]
MGVLVTVFLPLSLAFIMLALGLGLTVEDFRNIARRPRAFAAGAFAQLIVIPAIAYLVVIAFGIAPELAVGVMILALCPGGATSNMLTRIGQGDVALSVSLTGVISLTSAVTVPIMVAFFAWHFMGVDAPPVDVTRLALTMFAITVIPVVLGMVIKRMVPAADRFERVAVMIAGVLFVVIIVAAIAVNWTILIQSLPTLGPAIVTLIVVLLASGLAIARAAGLSRAQATALAVDTGIQNGTLGLTVGALLAVAELQSPFALPSAVYGVLMYVIGVPFVLWRRMAARRG